MFSRVYKYSENTHYCYGTFECTYVAIHTNRRCPKIQHKREEKFNKHIAGHSLRSRKNVFSRAQILRKHALLLWHVWVHVRCNPHKQKWPFLQNCYVLKASISSVRTDSFQGLSASRFLLTTDILACGSIQEDSILAGENFPTASHAFQAGAGVRCWQS